MTIDEAIVHAREVAEKKRRKAELSPKDNANVHIKSDCLQCAQEHEQLAKWLKELRRYRAIGTPEECLRNKDFLDFLSDKMNPNDFEIYLQIYNSQDAKGGGVDGN